MKTEILIITGACGVGKTTTSRTWATAKKGAVVECDYLTEWIYDPDFPRFSKADERFVAQLSVKIAKEYVDWGMSVVIENVWTPLGIDIIRQACEAWDEHITLKFIWLRCERKENHRRDELRSPENQMKERVDIVNDELQGYEWPEYLHRVDTTSISVIEVLSIINTLAPITGSYP